MVCSTQKVIEEAFKCRELFAGDEYCVSGVTDLGEPTVDLTASELVRIHRLRAIVIDDTGCSVPADGSR